MTVCPECQHTDEHDPERGCRARVHDPERGMSRCVCMFGVTVPADDTDPQDQHAAGDER